MQFNAETTVTKDKPTRYGVLTLYRVNVGKNFVGYVWSKRHFSYWGTEGWNRGLRSRDFHPIRWHAGKVEGESEQFGYSRRQVIARLLERKCP